MKFHENPSSGSRADTHGQTDGRTWRIGEFYEYANAPKNALCIWPYRMYVPCSSSEALSRSGKLDTPQPRTLQLPIDNNNKMEDALTSEDEAMLVQRFLRHEIMILETYASFVNVVA
jgi:hypothetical protein